MANVKGPRGIKRVKEKTRRTRKKTKGGRTGRGEWESHWNHAPLWSPMTRVWVLLLTVWCLHGQTGVSVVWPVGEGSRRRRGWLKCRQKMGAGGVQGDWSRRGSVNYQNVVSIHVFQKPVIGIAFTTLHVDRKSYILWYQLYKQSLKLAVNLWLSKQNWELIVYYLYMHRNVFSIKFYKVLLLLWNYSCRCYFGKIECVPGLCLW